MTTETKWINPFPGLRSFRQDEDYLFFGREEQTMELLQRLSSNRLLAVVGTSGSGKSSLVRCGLLSELQGGNMLDAGTLWEVAQMHPGGHPMSLLADALLEADMYDSDQHEAKERLMATLNRSRLGLVEAVRQADLPEGTNFLLVVDQFEELFRFHSAGKMQREAASEFVSTLLEACAQSEVPIYVVLTMRSDFIGDCSKFEGLAEAINAGEYLIPRLTWDQYKGVIEGPIRVGQAQIAPRLLQRLLNDVRQGHDQLPCLQHALMRTWEIWSGSDRSQPLDLEHYERAGKTSHALSLHADEIFDGLASDRQRKICESLFKALTVRESAQRGVRRPQSLQRLCEIIGVDSSELEPVIDAFRRHGVTFLMPAADVKLKENTVIDISHESLMRVWERLRNWVEQEAESVSIFHRLAESASLHQQGNVGLYRNPELGVALSWLEESKPTEDWAKQYGGQFTEAIKYLNRSREAATIEDRQREAARQKELEQAQQLAETERQRAEDQSRASTRLRWLVGGLGVVAAVALLASVLAARASNQAAKDKRAALDAKQREEQTNKQLERRLYLSDISEIGQMHTTGNLFHATQLLKKHIPMDEESKSDDQRGWEWYYWWRACHRESLTGVIGNAAGGIAVSQNQKWLAVRSTGWLLRIYDPSSFRLIATLGEHLEGGAITDKWNSVLFSPDNRLVATINYRSPKRIRMWRTDDWSEVSAVEHDEKQEAIAFSSTGQFAAMDANGEVTLWNVNQDPGQDLGYTREKQILKTGQKGLPQLTFSPDGTRLVTVGEPGTDEASSVMVWDVANRKLLKKLGGYRTEPRSVGWAVDGDRSRIAVGFVHGEVLVYDGTSYEVQHQLDVDGPVNALTFSKDGGKLAATNERTSSLHVWRLTKGRPRLLSTIRGHSRVISDVRFLGDGSELVTSSQDMERAVSKWDLRRSDAHEEVEDISGYYPSNNPPSFFNRRHLTNAYWHLSVSDSESEIESAPPDSRTAFSDDGNYRVRIEKDGESGFRLKRWMATDQGPVLLTDASIPIDAKLSRLWNFVISQDGTRIALNSGNQVATYDIAQSDKSVTAGAHWTLPFTPYYLEFAISPDGTMVAAKDFHRVEIRTVSGEKPLLKVTMLSDAGGATGEGIRFSPDGKYLVMAEWFNQIRMLEIETQEQSQFRGHTGAVGPMDFSPDGTLLVSGGTDDGTIRLWDVKSQELLLTLPAHRQGVNSVAFSPDGQTIASFGRLDEGIRLWSAATEKELRDSPEYWLHLAKSAANRKDLKSEVSNLSDVIDRAAALNVGMLYGQRAKVNLELESWEQAAQDFVAYLESDSFAAYSKRRQDWEMNFFAGKDECFEAFMPLRADDIPSELWLARGRVLALRRDWKAASEAYRHCESEATFSDHSAIEIAGSHLLTGDNIAFRKLFRQMIEQAGEDLSVRECWTLLFLNTMSPEQTVPKIRVKKWAEERLSKKEPGKLRFKGLFYFQAGQPERAIEFLEEGIATERELEVTYGHLIKSLIYLDVGEPGGLENARESLRLGQQAMKNYFEDDFPHIAAGWIILHALIQKAETELAAAEASEVQTETNVE